MVLVDGVMHVKDKCERLELVNKIFKDARKEENMAELKAESDDEKVETFKTALENAQKEPKESHGQLDQKKKWRKTVQMRLQLIAKIAAEEDNSDLDDNNDPAPTDNGASESADENCKVCFENYAEGDHQKAAVIPCGHQACFGCLSSLPQKTCPTCRADFTDDKILKLFPWSQNLP